jgi:flagellar biosynthesis/type III secretory pathway chaperone
MHELIEDLIQVLRQSENLYAGLGTVLEQEPRFILAGDMQGLAHTAAEKERLLSCLADLERQQEGLRHQIARHYQLAPDISLALLAEQLPLPSRQRLHEIGASLSNRLHSIQKLNRESRLLVHHCLKSVHNALSFLTSWSDPTPVYAASGALGSGAPGGRLLSSNV